MGTWTHIEKPESRRMSLADRWGESSLELVYLSYWTPSGSGDPFPGQGSLITNMPIRPQQRAPVGVYGTPPSPLLGSMICRSVSVEPTRERPYAYIVRAQLSTNYFSYNDNPWGLEYCKQTRTATFRTIPIYRRGFTFPANGDVTWPTGVVDIAGTKVDTNGNPRSFKVTQQSISIEVMVDRTPPVGTTPQYTALDPNWGTLSSYLNKRNSVAFLGWPIGTVLCSGLTGSLDNEWWRIQVSFVVDDWFHLEQVPIVNRTGLPVLKPGVTIAGDQINQVEKVGFFQPYSDTKMDFNAMFGTNVSDQFTKAGPEEPV